MILKEPGVYVTEFENPPSGWRAFFIRAKVQGAGNQIFEFTSEAHVIPDVFPFNKCSGDACKGVLV